MTAQGTDDKFVFEGVEYRPGDLVTLTYLNREITATLVFNGEWLKTQGSDTMPLVYVIQKQQGDGDSSLGAGVTNLRKAPESGKTQEVSETSDADSRIATLIKEKTEVEVAFEEFKKEVGLKAAELKIEHGWCEVVDDAMRDLGIEMPSGKKRIRLVVEFDVVAGPNLADPTEEWTWDSFQIEDDGAVTMDGDWEVESIEKCSHSINFIEDWD